MSAEMEAEWNLAKIFGALQSSSWQDANAMTWVYRTYDGGTNRNEQAKVISAEKVLLADPGRNYITPILLFTSAYLSSECGIKGGLRSVTNWGEPLRHHGSAFRFALFQLIKLPIWTHSGGTPKVHPEAEHGVLFHSFG